MKQIVLLLFPLFLISCSESKILLTRLNKHQAPLGYLHDSKILDCNKSSSLTLSKVDNRAFDTLTSVSKINQKVYPFLIYNYAEINLAVSLGQNSLEQNYPDFFKKSFILESQRTGCYSLSDNSNESVYTVEITFDTCKINTIYQKKTSIIFLLFAYSINTQEIGLPSKAKLALNVKLKKNDNLMFEKNYLIERTQPFLNSKNNNANKFSSDIISNMAESLSLSTKDCIEQIINDINDAIEKN